MNNIFSSAEGWEILALYAFLIFIITWLYSKSQINTKLNFLVSGRIVSGWYVAFSIAATWVWAPALFVSAQKAYTEGLIGLAWFTVPNVATLFIFGYIASKFRNLQLPDGWTFSDHIRTTFKKKVHNIYLAESIGLQTCSFAVQLLAGAAILSPLTGISFFWLTIALALIPLTYSLYSGIRASIATDYWQMIWILLVVFIGVPFLIVNAGGIESIANGFGGISGKYNDWLSEQSFMTMVSWGLTGAIGLLSAAFGDQMMWQRVFSVKKESIKKAFYGGAIIFAFVPILLGCLGFALAGNGVKIPDAQLTNLEAVLKYMPMWFLIPFLFLILSGLMSTVDSVICALSSVIGHDVLERTGKKYPDNFVVLISRLAMFAVAIAGIGIANISGLKIMYLWLFYGTLRTSVFIPSIMVIKKVYLTSTGMFWGILLAIITSLPLIVIGSFYGLWYYTLAGTIATLFFSSVVVKIISNLTQEKI